MNAYSGLLTSASFCWRPNLRFQAAWLQNSDDTFLLWWQKPDERYLVLFASIPLLIQALPVTIDCLLLTSNSRYIRLRTERRERASDKSSLSLSLWPLIHHDGNALSTWIPLDFKCFVANWPLMFSLRRSERNVWDRNASNSFCIIVFSKILIHSSLCRCGQQTVALLCVAFN